MFSELSGHSVSWNLQIYIPDIGVMLFCRLVLLLFDELFCSRGVSLHSGHWLWLPSWHCVLVCGLILDITICFCFCIDLYFLSFFWRSENVKNNLFSCLQFFQKTYKRFCLILTQPNCYFTRLNPKRINPFEFCLSALLGMHRNTRQKYFLKSSKGFLR